MIRIRLSRTGSKKQPSYRVVVADVKSKRDGRIVERIGHYNPRRHPEEYMIDEDRALYWLSVGAQPSDAVQRLLVQQGTIERLGRLQKGESRAALVAEFMGVPLEEAVEVEAAEVAEATSETAETVSEVEVEVVEEVASQLGTTVAFDEEE